MIAILEYGLGNVRAFYNIYTRLGYPVKQVSTATDLLKAKRIILPGVGSFDWAMQSLEQSGLRETLDELVLNKGVPILGVCVGMQIMMASSEEGVEPGLGWVQGSVKKFKTPKSDAQKLILPHMGWNNISVAEDNTVIDKTLHNGRFYFLHSYYVDLSGGGEIIAETTYHQSFCSGFRFGSIFGIQFHPEKSHDNGVNLLKNFAEYEVAFS